MRGLPLYKQPLASRAINQARCRQRGRPGLGAATALPPPGLLRAGKAGEPCDQTPPSQRETALPGVRGLSGALGEAWGPWRGLLPPPAPCCRCSAGAATTEARVGGTGLPSVTRVQRYWHFNTSSWGSFPNVSFPCSSIISAPQPCD